MFTLHTDNIIPYSEDEAQCLLRLVWRGCRKGRGCVRRTKREANETTLTDYIYHLRVDTRSSRRQSNGII
ncbi:uncharacterized protein STEHIDRAFT_120151 [Stereum hirsutum FP-91666 SS1]|uniref:uncharacterized protein n=1 Tax=Stereum hirsutum (strain FP-91666) TaxID=721885 RepID=UPI000440C175|nr:uncharacterized protein STEHIDRAFT_118959 [Stereum hirsutum FP-91666 SS1]XP_007302648.1 uncharacterized protein STEHIDRAFT_120151 [Stereum hirsutum FP-91666 SS1]EIM87915.1 hypothetical protein STEHIDRAFT_120151 [Stereum hirsutum FP-91666 SS1]EIM89868.1 hypothetical protein STEHIDRAFT_118959 [Stereum hirsutum FP-91666 SS1]